MKLGSIEFGGEGRASGWGRWFLVAWVAVGMLWSGGARGQGVMLSELMAGGQGSNVDEDGETSDWLEIRNAGAETVSLLGWGLTDDRGRPGKWRFPATNLGPDQFLLVYASGKNRSVAGRELHTNFRLSSQGEYLGLSAADGRVASEWAPQYPMQAPGVSFGVASRLTRWVGLTSRLRYWVPGVDEIPADWMQTEFDDGGWKVGVNGVGFEDRDGEFAGLIRTDVKGEMFHRATVCLLRIPFVVTNEIGRISDLRMAAQVDDGFVAWINGVEVARTNVSAPNVTAGATAGQARPDFQARAGLEFLMGRPRSILRPGTNVLAVALLNVDLKSSDLLFLGQLTGQVQSEASTRLSGARYLARPTPGRANTGAGDGAGPLFFGISQIPTAPVAPRVGESVWVFARMGVGVGAIRRVELHYRVGAGREGVLAMRLREETGGGDGKGEVYEAVLPGGLAVAGQRVEYWFTAVDEFGNGSRWPLAADRDDAQAVLGTVVAGEGMESRLEVMRIFSDGDPRDDRDQPTRGAVYFRGEYYDNVGLGVHGQFSRRFPKKSYHLDFPRDHRFAVGLGGERVKDVNLLSNYADKSKVRNTVAYELIAAAGSVGHFAFPVRVEWNGKFHGVMDLVEDGDDRFLARVGRDSLGALYKINENLSQAGAGEKKTRKNEDSEDLELLIQALSDQRSEEWRVRWLYDHVDLPQVVSFFAAMALISSDDHGHKNYYLYRDTRRTGDWSIFPWDVDLSLGRNWTGQYFDERIFSDNPLDLYREGRRKARNPLYELFFRDGNLRAMYLRRLRTLADELLKPPGSALGESFLEKRVAYWMDRLDPAGVEESDAAMDDRVWRRWGNRTTARQEAERIVTEYLEGRRQFLYRSGRATLGGDALPAAQPEEARVELGEVDAAPMSGKTDERYVEVVNPNAFAMDVSGWRVMGAGVDYEFRPGTVIPARRSLYCVADVMGYRRRRAAPTAGMGFQAQGGWRGRFSAELGPIRLVDSRGRVVDEVGVWSRPPMGPVRPLAEGGGGAIE